MVRDGADEAADGGDEPMSVVGRHAQRGQALIETAIFLPLMILAMFAILYFSQFGVLQERAQSAVRYGALVSYNKNSSTYSAQDIYHGIYLDQIYDTTQYAPVSCDASIDTDVQNALTQSVAAGGAAPSPTPQPFWKPAADSTYAAPCDWTINKFGFTPSAADYSSSKANNGAYYVFTMATHTVTATLPIEPYLHPVLGADTANNVSAGIGVTFLHADPPSVIMFCTGPVATAVNASLKQPVTFTPQSC